MNLIFEKSSKQLLELIYTLQFSPRFAFTLLYSLGKAKHLKSTM